jgi:hypothetical protein
MTARSSRAPSIGRIQKRKTNLLQIIIFGLQRAAGPYRRATFRLCTAAKPSKRSVSLTRPAFLAWPVVLPNRPSSQGMSRPDSKMLRNAILPGVKRSLPNVAIFEELHYAATPGSCANRASSAASSSLARKACC